MTKRLNVVVNAIQAKGFLERGCQIAEYVTISEYFRYEAPVRFWSGVYLNGVQIGAFSYVSPNSTLHMTEIGRYCSIGQRLTVLSSHPNNWLTSSPLAYEPVFAPPFRRDRYSALAFELLKPVRLGHDVWIGADVSLKGGITIGNGAIIGAGAVVVKDVAPYSVVGGVPARLIRMRFEPDLIARLEQVKWWQYDLSNHDLPFDRPETALDAIEVAVRAGTLLPYTPKWVDVN